MKKCIYIPVHMTNWINILVFDDKERPSPAYRILFLMTVTEKHFVFHQTYTKNSNKTDCYVTASPYKGAI